MSVDTGIYRRVQRDGKWVNLLLEDHTEKELLGMWHMELECGSAAQQIVNWMYPVMAALKMSEMHRIDLQKRLAHMKSVSDK